MDIVGTYASAPTRIDFPSSQDDAPIIPYESISIATLLNIKTECEKYARQSGFANHQAWQGSKDKLEEPILDQDGEQKQWEHFVKNRHRWPMFGYGEIYGSGPLEVQTRERIHTFVGSQVQGQHTRGAKECGDPSSQHHL
jgi:hypothetical protein